MLRSYPANATTAEATSRNLREAARTIGLQIQFLNDGSFDYLGGKGVERRWNCEAECLGGFEVQNHLELGGLPHRHVSGLLALENPAGIRADLTKTVRRVGSKVHQPAGHDILRQSIN